MLKINKELKCFKYFKGPFLHSFSKTVRRKVPLIASALFYTNVLKDIQGRGGSVA